MSVYKELFSITIMHDYYTDGFCPDFSLEPTPECREILEGHRIVLKSKVSGVQLAIDTDEENEYFIDISAVSKFTFYMKLEAMAFGNYTVLDAIGEDQIYGYTNKKDTEEVESGELLSIPLKKSEVTLPVNDVAVFGIIDIHVDPLRDTNTPSQYTIGFTARAIDWSYYFITNPSPLKTISVYNEEIVFSPVTIDGNDPIGQELQEKYPDNDILLYRSGDHVSYRQQGIRNIELRVADIMIPESAVSTPQVSELTTVENTLIEHLPNPDIYDNGIKIIKVTL